MSSLHPHPLHQSVRPASPGASTTSSDCAARKIAAEAVEAPSCPVAWGTWLRKYQLGSWCEPVAPHSSPNPNCSASDGTTTTFVAPSAASTSSHTEASAATASAEAVSPAANASSKSCQPFEVSKAHRYVKLDSESMIDSMDFYKKNGWLAAPPLPRRTHRRVAEALRRHGLTGAQEREALSLYIKHAKAVFKCEYASFMVESTDETYMLILAQDGGDPSVQIVPRTVTLCSHAMLLPDDEVLVVSNTQKDWRFRSCPSTLAGTVTNAKGKPMNFYASAPLFLSYSLYGIEGRVQVGRLCIMDEQPRENFDEKDADLLYAIGNMAGDALEKEFQSHKNAKAAEMQQRTSSLIRSLEDATLHAHFRHFNESHNSSSSDSGDEGYSKYSLVVIDKACRELRECLGADAVAAFDVSNFRFRRQAPKSVSPRTSIALSNPTVPNWHLLEEKALGEPTTPPSESVSTPTMIDPDSPMISPRMSRNISSNDSGAMLHAVDLQEGSPPPSILSFSGPDTCRPHTPEDMVRLKAIFAGPLARMASDTNMNIRCKFYRRQNETSSMSSDEDDDVASMPFSERTKDPWADLLPLDTNIGSYAVCVCYNRAKARPGIMFLIMFKREACFDQQERFFVESTMQISLGSLLRQKLSEVDFFQAEFLRHVQHNLRTPLHGALGAVEYLRAAISNDDDDDDVKIDLSADGVLATLLESISLSGLTLNSYIDDLLSFQNLSGIKAGVVATVKRTSADIVKIVESVADEEFEFAQRLELQSRQLEPHSAHAQEGPLTGVELIIKASPEVRDFEWVVDVKALQDVVRKVVSNAIRFTRQGYVEISIRLAPPGALDEVDTQVSAGHAAIELEVADTGVGMTKDFCTNQLTRPFTKGDSFRDGIGLGMTIVSSTLQKFGGKLSVASEVNVGTRVTMCMPLQRGSGVHGRNGSVASAAAPRFAVSKMAYYGLETRGLRRLANAICEHFMPLGGIELTRDYSQADCIVLPERAAASLDEGDSPLLSQIKPDARFVVISSTHLMLNPGVEKLDGRAVLPLNMPHGPSSLRLLETFLSDEVPMLIHTSHSVRANPQHRGSIDYRMGSYPRRMSGHLQASADASRGSNGQVDVNGNGNDRGSGSGSGGASSTQSSEGTTVTSMVESPTDLRNGSKILPPITTQLSAKRPRAPLETEKQPRRDEFRVLVVEDNPINMKLLTTLCKRLDIRYEEAHDGAEAVSKFVAFKPSVVLLDISLPVQDGFEACTQMRAHNHPSYIVAVTALSSEEDKARGIDSCGMDAWMTKPVSPKQLKGDLETWKREFELTRKGSKA